MKHVAVVIDWYGPYTLNEAETRAAEDFQGGLYLGIGRSGPFRGVFRSIRPLYVGKSDGSIADRLNADHHKLRLIKSYRSIWLGDIISGGVPGRRRHSTPTEIRLGEWVIAHFMQLPLNERLRENPPDGNVTVLNRWFAGDETLVDRPHSDWPDLIDYRGINSKTRLVWFGSRKMKEVLVTKRRIRRTVLPNPTPGLILYALAVLIIIVGALWATRLAEQ